MARIPGWTHADAARFAVYLSEHAEQTLATTKEDARKALIATYGPLARQRQDNDRVAAELRTALVCTDLAGQHLSAALAAQLWQHASTHAQQALLLLTGSRPTTWIGGCDCAAVAEPG